jgi:ABC-2 type transport system permease protein
MRPFEGMPRHAQWFAEVFPLTHFLRIVRGIVLKDVSLTMLTPERPLGLFLSLG